MPEGYTHVRTAQKAAHAIHYKLQCPAAFAAGANGPDSFFCYEVWKKGQNRTYNLPLLGNRMHEDKTGAFLLALLHHTHTQAQIEYTLGFLCHYAADTVMHPYVVFVSSPGQPYGMKGGHGYFEIALDSTLHAEDTGVSEVPADHSSPVPVGQDLAEIAALLHQCILEVYGQDISVEALADSFYYTYRLRRLFTSRHGGAFALLKDAQHRCELFMTAALGHWMGKLDEKILEKTLGSMSYITGTETEQSKSQQVPDAEQAGETA